MPVFDQGYQHWQGTLSGHGGRWLAIARQGIRAQLRNRRTKYLIIAAWTPALGLAAFLAIWGLFEKKADVLQPFLDIFQKLLPLEIFDGPRAFRSSIWTIAIDTFLWIETGLALLLVLLVGPDLISQDLRYNAMPLYLSRPMRRFHYFTGKLGVIVGFLAMVTVVPALIAYIVGVAFSLDWTVVRDTWRVLAGSLVYGVVIALACGLTMLAFSSLSRNSRAVAMIWVGLWLITGGIAGTLVDSTRNRLDPHDAANGRWWVLSFGANLDRLREATLDTPEAYRHVVDAFQRAAASAANIAQGHVSEVGRGPFGLPFGRRNRQGMPPPPPPPTAMEPPPMFANLITPPFPWSWSVGVLAGLSLVSIAVLSNRIKSLDRLR
jgi:ABC-2 type transport system permease protein